MESSPPFTAVQPVKPAAPYIGGKRMLARRLVDLIETIPHRTYAEPFVEMMRWQITSRAEFERLVAVDPDTLTDMQRAARFLYLQRAAFGGKVSHRHFGVSHHRPARFDVTRLAAMLEDLSERLAGVVVERLPWAAFIARYDTPETLFYLDPPYYDCEGDYGPAMFCKADFVEMATVLGGLKGRFILSLNDRPEVREIFAAFDVQGVGTHYGLAGRGSQEAREVIITGLARPA